MSQVPRIIEIYYFLDARFFSKFKANQKGSDGSRHHRRHGSGGGGFIRWEALPLRHE